jgi:hypothetical protein
VLKVRHLARHVDFEFIRPATPVLLQSCPITGFEPAWVQMSVFRLGYEDLGCIARIDICVFEQKPKVK